MSYAALILFPICAWKPVLIADTDRPRKNIRTHTIYGNKKTHTRSTRLARHKVQSVLLVENSVGRLANLACNVLHCVPRQHTRLTIRDIHSPIYFLNTFSICFCVYLPFITNLCAPSTLPVVPNSEYKN